MSFGIVASIAGPVLGSLISGDSAENAADTQSASADRSTALQGQIYGDTKSNLEPYRNTGGLALSDLRYLLGIGPNESTGSGVTNNSSQFFGGQAAGNYGLLSKPFTMGDFQNSPAYQFNLEQGQNAINKAAAARGKYYAPSTLQDISKYSQGLASNEFQNAFNNYNTGIGNIYNRLSGLSGSGQNAAVQQGGFGANYAQNVGNNITGAGNAQAAAGLYGNNALQGGINAGYNNYLRQAQSPTYGSSQNVFGGGSNGYVPDGFDSFQD